MCYIPLSHYFYEAKRVRKRPHSLARLCAFAESSLRDALRCAKGNLRRPRAPRSCPTAQRPKTPRRPDPRSAHNPRRRNACKMPQKHSKNNGSSTYGVFSYGERKQCSFMSSIDERTGADAQLPFGWCALSLQPAKDPVCTPSGHIYSRESLLEHMVSKGDELKAARAKWDADRAREAKEAGQQRNEDDRQLLLEFEQTNDATRAHPSRSANVQNTRSRTSRHQYQPDRTPWSCRKPRRRWISRRRTNIKRT